jgi:hypothetical protein
VVTVRLVNPETEERINAGNAFTMTALRPDRSPASSELGITSGTLVSGEAIIAGQHYATSEQIVIKVSDARGRETFSGPLTVSPVGVRYAMAVPDTVIAGQPWTMSVSRVDIVTGELVRGDDRSFLLRAYSGNAPRPDPSLTPQGILADSVGTTEQGIMTFTAQRYDRAEAIYLRVSDDTHEQAFSEVITVLAAPASELSLWAEELPGQPLTRPLRPQQTATLLARTTDPAGNPVADVPVEFQILTGDGRLGAAEQLQFATVTNHDGRATVELSVLDFGREDVYLEVTSAALTSAPLLVAVIGPPRTTLSFDPAASVYGDGYYISADTRITLTATTEDPGGIQAIFFDVDVVDPPQPGQVYTGDFSLADLGLDSPGLHTLRFFAQEVSGATEAVQRVPLYTAVSLETDRTITNRPNPFDPGHESTIILFQPPRSGTVTLTIYDLYGDVVYSRQLTVQAGGTEQYAWDGCNGEGRIVANGGYICRIHGVGMDLRRKIAVVK